MIEVETLPEWAVKAADVTVPVATASAFTGVTGGLFAAVVDGPFSSTARAGLVLSFVAMFAAVAWFASAYWRSTSPVRMAMVDAVIGRVPLDDAADEPDVVVADAA